MNILIIDDDETLCSLLAKELTRAGHQVTVAYTGREGLGKATEADVVLLDLLLPDQPGIEVLKRLRAERATTQVIVFTAHGTIDTAIVAMKLGAYDYLRKPCHLEELGLTLTRAYECGRLGQENARLRDGLSGAGVGMGPDFLGRGPVFEELKRFVAKVAPSDSTVLLRGETGVGKELVARAIHRLSPRCDKPFVVVDCAVLNEEFLQSELFGHEKGAFTGANRLKHGLFETADGGTLFLDEVGDVSPSVQASLLRVLETSSFRRLGANREVKVNVRLVAATNRDLDRMMKENHFRDDLYFRLANIQVELLPLRRRVEDIPILVEHFVAHHNSRCGTRKRLAPDTMEALKRYPWPGNVRELRHAVERTLVLSDGDVAGVADLPGEVRQHVVAQTDAAPLVEIEKDHIRHVLAEVNGHRSRAARVLGISERSLYRKIREHQLEPDFSGTKS